MALRDLIPWNRGSRPLPVQHETRDAFQALREDMNRLFDRFLTPWWEPEWPEAWPTLEDVFAPRADVAERDQHIEVRAELPGMEEKDIEVSVDGDRLVLQGERKEEHEDRDRQYYRRESSYGRFYRAIPLPAEVEAEKAEADFSRGVLTVRLPKTPEARHRRKQIPVKTA